MKRGWLKRIADCFFGITEEDHHLCEKLSEMTGLDWKIEHLGESDFAFAQTDFKCHLPDKAAADVIQIAFSDFTRDKTLPGIVWDDGVYTVNKTTLENFVFPHSFDAHKFRQELDQELEYASKDESGKSFQRLTGLKIKPLPSAAPTSAVVYRFPSER